MTAIESQLEQLAVCLENPIWSLETANWLADLSFVSNCGYVVGKVVFETKWDVTILTTCTESSLIEGEIS